MRPSELADSDTSVRTMAGTACMVWSQWQVAHLPAAGVDRLGLACANPKCQLRANRVGGCAATRGEAETAMAAVGAEPAGRSAGAATRLLQCCPHTKPAPMLGSAPVRCQCANQTTADTAVASASACMSAFSCPRLRRQQHPSNLNPVIGHSIGLQAPFSIRRAWALSRAQHTARVGRPLEH